MRKYYIPKVSKKQVTELAKRSKLKMDLIRERGAVCMTCGRRPDFKDGRGELHLSHTIPLARGGKTTRENCKLLCRKCHNQAHNIREV